MAKYTSSDKLLNIECDENSFSVNTLHDILLAIAKILNSTRDILLAVGFNEPTRMAREIPLNVIEIYEQILKIKEVLES